MVNECTTYYAKLGVPRKGGLLEHKAIKST